MIDVSLPSRRRLGCAHELGWTATHLPRPYRSVYLWVIYTEPCGRCADGADPVRTQVAAGVSGRPWAVVGPIVQMPRRTQPPVTHLGSRHNPEFAAFGRRYCTATRVRVMKLSVTLSDEDSAILDAYFNNAQLPTRSAGLHRAVQLLR